jgi:hypothetical protein
VAIKVTATRDDISVLLANADFVAGLERLRGRPIARRAPGRKKAIKAPSQDELPFGN